MDQPIIEKIEITAMDRNGPMTCTAICNDGQRITLPIKGFSKSYEKGSLSEATLTMFGFRVEVTEVGQSDFVTNVG